MRKTVLLLASTAMAMLLVGAVALVGMEGSADAAPPRKNGKIAFVVPHDFELETYGIFTMRSNGTQVKRILYSSWGDIYFAPRWSPDGTKIATQEFNGETYGISVMNADGSQNKRVTPLASNGEDYRGTVWSPDGKKLLFRYSDWDGNEGLYTMNADGSDQRLLIAGSIHSFDWPPGGDRIMFIQHTASDETGVSSICTITPSGTSWTLAPRTSTSSTPGW